MLALETRRRIYAHVCKHPGAYLREIQRALLMSMGALEYHLSQLEAAGLVRAEMSENKRYYAMNVPERDARLLGLLRQALTRRVILVLLESGPSSHQDLMRATGLRSSTLSYHARKLTEAELVAREKLGRETTYRLVDADRVIRLLVEHRESFLDRVLDRFLEGFDAMGVDRERRPPP